MRYANKFAIDLYKSAGLNPRFGFHNYIYGGENSETYKSVKEFVKNFKGSRILYLYGNIGCGKTHLLNACGNYALKQDSMCKILYTESDQLVADILSEIRNSTICQYRDKLTSYDLLIIDDLEFFARKEKSQQDLQIIIESIMSNNGKLIFAAQTPPNQIIQLDHRLKSVCNSGAIYTVNPLSDDTKMKLVVQKAKELSLNLSDKQIDIIIHWMGDNVRELEGLLIRLSVFVNRNNIDSLTEEIMLQNIDYIGTV